jgi:hypothetical protein
VSCEELERELRGNGNGGIGGKIGCGGRGRWVEDLGGCLGRRKIKKREREREQKTRETKGMKEGIWFGYRCGGKHL